MTPGATPSKNEKAEPRIPRRCIQATFWDLSPQHSVLFFQEEDSFVRRFIRRQWPVSL